MIDKAVNIEVKTGLQLSSEIKKINSRCLKSYRLLAKKKKTKPIKSTKIRIKTKIKLSFITPCLLIQFSFKLRRSKKTNVMEVAKETIELLKSILIRLPKKIKIKPKT